ncbi:Holliday junction resolvase RecU [Pueribacillus theae]|uniref:Holliday junction resolvase RecU n=1 Tax=Pueribacillus theae TaxID=2171751 RepID=A0A2U1JUS9_9BACI|nr:Holliday junction resolvase RecU [Pueribacillus theae]PWA08902.1 Holliday junction resolvase RecU [Pueribacillus theae]
MLHYPNGKKNIRAAKNRKQENFSNKHANRGMTLEEDLNITNEYYLSIGKAVIHKKPTPVQIVNVSYPKRSAAIITEAYFKLASTTDYNGVYKGKYIDFEAKETKNKTSFPLNNFHAHQIEHMKKVDEQGGICFVILKFVYLDTIYFLEAKHLFYFWDNQFQNGRKSIPFMYIEENGIQIPLGFNPRVDYLSIIDNIYFSKGRINHD